MSRISPLILAASAVNEVTRATPINSGAAVREVRFGLRAAFCRAIAPVTPRNFATGAPIIIAILREIAGPIKRTPANNPSAPKPSVFAPAPFIEDTRPYAPPASKTALKIIRRRKSFTVSNAVSRIAANGETRPARSAGRTAESTVITVPTMTVKIIAFGSIVKPLDGISRPSAFSKALSA